MKRILLASMLLVLPIAAAAESRELTYVDLVNRMIDIERLAVPPQPGDRSEQWSSYDRKSRYDPETDSYIQWAANDDGTGFVRKEGDLYVLAEIGGPGCIWRIRPALATEGHVKIYLDGTTEPTVDLPFSGYFNGENPPFTYPSLVHEVAHGLNGYVPIPFQKSCKIVAEEGWGKYFHFTYQKFPEGTVVPTFTRELSADDEAAPRAVDEFLSNRLGTDPAGSRPGEITQRTNVPVPAGETVTVAEITGERAISAFRVRLDREALGDPANALRQIVLRITWDDDKAPAVWCPLGDFFGTAPGINYYESLLAGMTGEEFYSLWYMPFGEKALIEVVNESNAEVRMAVAITHAPLSSPIEELGRFHVKWHRDALLPAQP
ncbi:MAG: DUF2961 domain-containing protein, partial [Candidatus Brocadiia bacterium]|nr:DUF2961 domain-containing protein [Candidatus Brocadiia bacterium]